MKYKLSKGFWKAVKTIGSGVVLLVVFAGLGDVSIWDLAVQYVKPIVGALTVTGLLTMIVNYAKVKSA